MTPNIKSLKCAFETYIFLDVMKV